MTETYMAIETRQAPDVVARMLEQNRAALAEIGALYQRRQPSHFITCARGSSDHAAAYFKYLAEIELGAPCCSIGASVVSIYGARLRLRDTILVTISQSGRSPDILALLEEGKRAGVPTIAIVNDGESPLALAADICLPLCAGPELSVAATKTFIASAAMSAAIVSACRDDARMEAAIANLPTDLGEAASLSWSEVEDVVAKAQSMYVIGRGPSLPMAQEAALKLKETSGLHAEGFSAAEVMHGPMELVNEGFPVLVFSPNDDSAATTAASAGALQDAGAKLLRPAIHAALHPALDPITTIQSFYGAAERVSRLRGRDPDRPRLLKKVTRTM